MSSSGVSVCWRGPPGSGKRQALQQQLQLWAESIGQLYVLKKQFWDAPSQGGEDENDEKDDSDEKALLPMEYSVVHWGFDVARMSLQDKQFIKSILQKWGRGSQVLGQGTGKNKRCLVLYHAHLLSSESILFLQAFLEENSEDSVLWLTSEHPLPSRLSDWCIEMAMPSQEDKSLLKLQRSVSNEYFITIEEEIIDIYKKWMSKRPTLGDVKEIRSIVYSLLHRNIRWIEGFHHWLFALEKLPLTKEQKLKIALICKTQPFTGPGQTVPSYRIPVLWENYLINLREALAPAPTEEKTEGIINNEGSSRSRTNKSSSKKKN
jgi:hypothetical protein